MRQVRDVDAPAEELGAVEVDALVEDRFGADTDGHFTTDYVGIRWIEHSQDRASTSGIVDALRDNAAAIFADVLPP